MKILFYFGFFIAGTAAFLCFGGAQGAIHEILAGVLALISTLFLTAAALLSALENAVHRIERFERNSWNAQGAILEELRAPEKDHSLPKFDDTRP